MKKIKFYIRQIMAFSVLSAAMLFVACSDDVETDDVGDGPIASFQYEVDETNFLQVTLTNFSQNAVEYSWDFGDGTDPSMEEGPIVYTYAEANDYVVTLTVTDADGVSSAKSETISLTDPDQALTLLAGTESKKWIVQREDIVLMIGPNPPYDATWWSFGGVTPLGERPCILDDTYTFYRDGRFENNTNGTFFMDSEGNGGWNDAVVGGEGCVDETTANAFISSTDKDFSALANGGSYTFDYDVAGNTIKTIGEGAYIALPKVQTSGDIGKDGDVASDITYEVVKFVDGPVADSLHLVVGGSWTFLLVSYDDESNMPDIPTLAVNAAFSFKHTDLEATFTNSSNSKAVNFSWNFGDGNTSTDENPVHTYADYGTYTVTLNTDDGEGNTATATQEVEIDKSLPITPTTMSHTFESATSFVELGAISGASIITVGTDDPAGGATKVGTFERTTDQFQEAKLQVSPDVKDIDFENITTISVEVYLPSSNTYSEDGLVQSFLLGLADQTDTPEWWNDVYNYETADIELDKWVSLSYAIDTDSQRDHSPKDRVDLDMIYLQLGGGGHTAAGTFYIRNLEFK